MAFFHLFRWRTSTTCFCSYHSASPWICRRSWMMFWYLVWFIFTIDGTGWHAYRFMRAIRFSREQKKHSCVTVKAFGRRFKWYLKRKMTSLDESCSGINQCWFLTKEIDQDHSQLPGSTTSPSEIMRRLIVCQSDLSAELSLSSVFLFSLFLSVFFRDTHQPSRRAVSLSRSLAHSLFLPHFYRHYISPRSKCSIDDCSHI